MLPSFFLLYCSVERNLAHVLSQLVSFGGATGGLVILVQEGQKANYDYTFPFIQAVCL